MDSERLHSKTVREVSSVRSLSSVRKYQNVSPIGGNLSKDLPSKADTTHYFIAAAWVAPARAFFILASTSSHPEMSCFFRRYSGSL